MNFCKLETKRLVLRTLQDSDIEDFLHFRSNADVARYQYWEPFSRKEALEYIENNKCSKPAVPGKWFQLGIVYKDNGRLIGDCALKLDLWEPRIAEVGCNISYDYQKKGLAAEALKRVFEFAFSELLVHRIIAITDCENVACIKLLEKLKMRREGHYIKNVWFKGDWGSEYSYAILAREWFG